MNDYDWLLCFLILRIYLKIISKNKYKDDDGKDCFLSVDGTDVHIPKRDRNRYPQKFKKSGLCYRVACQSSLETIVWLVGLISLEFGMIWDLSQLSCDTSWSHWRCWSWWWMHWRGTFEAKYLMCVTCPCERKLMMKLVGNSKETCNKRLKWWSILVNNCLP